MRNPVENSISSQSILLLPQEFHEKNENTEYEIENSLADLGITLRRKFQSQVFYVMNRGSYSAVIGKQAF